MVPTRDHLSLLPPDEGPTAGWRQLGRTGRAALLSLILLSAGLDSWFALFWPSELRFWDERYNARNVVAALSDDPLAQFNGYYPPLTWAPQAGALAVAEHLAPWFGQSLRPWDGRQLTPNALRFCRLTAVLTGAATLFVVFLLAARLFDPWTGLGAVALLGFCPWHLNSSAMFKPDAPLALASALAALAIAEAARGPSRKRYLAMALAVALAASAKQTGLALALPALVVVLAQVREPEVLRRHLPLAAAAGGGLLALLNFPLLFLLDDLETIVRFYAKREQQTGETRLTALGEIGHWLLDWGSFGQVLGALALAGLALWALLALRGLRRREPLAWPRVAALSVPLTYVGFYLALTAHFKENNFLPVLQSLAIGGALVTARASGAIARRISPRSTRLMPALALLALVGARGSVAVDYVYRSVTPTTFDVLMAEADRRGLLLVDSVVFTEWLDPGRIRYELEKGVPGQHSVAVLVPSVAALAPERRLHADGEVALADRSPQGAATAADGLVLHALPRFLRVRGPALEGRFRPWPATDELTGFDSQSLPREAQQGSTIQLPLPDAVEPGDTLQLVVWLGTQEQDESDPPSAWSDQQPLVLHGGSQVNRGTIWSSERWRSAEAAPALRLELPSRRPGLHWATAIYRWRGWRPAAATQHLGRH